MKESSENNNEKSKEMKSPENVNAIALFFTN